MFHVKHIKISIIVEKNNKIILNIKVLKGRFNNYNISRETLVL